MAPKRGLRRRKPYIPPKRAILVYDCKSNDFIQESIRGKIIYPLIDAIFIHGKVKCGMLPGTKERVVVLDRIHKSGRRAYQYYPSTSYLALQRMYRMRQSKWSRIRENVINERDNH